MSELVGPPVVNVTAKTFDTPGPASLDQFGPFQLEGWESVLVDFTIGGGVIAAQLQQARVSIIGSNNPDRPPSPLVSGETGRSFAVPSHSGGVPPSTVEFAAPLARPYTYVVVEATPGLAGLVYSLAVFPTDRRSDQSPQWAGLFGPHELLAGIVSSIPAGNTVTTAPDWNYAGDVHWRAKSTAAAASKIELVTWDFGGALAVVFDTLWVSGQGAMSGTTVFPSMPVQIVMTNNDAGPFNFELYLAARL